jgi:hypothetical protein
MTRAFSLRILDEPLVAFGVGQGTRIKEGLAAFGPFSQQLGPAHPSVVRLGVVGTRDAVEPAVSFLRGLTTPLRSLRDQRLSPDFPGTSVALASEFATEPSWVIELDRTAVSNALELAPHEAFVRCLTLWADGIRALADRDSPPDLVVCALPEDLLTHCRTVTASKERRARHPRRGRRDQRDQMTLFDIAFDQPTLSIDAAGGPPTEDTLVFRDFRRALKAAAMPARLPIQLVTPGLFEEGRKGQQDPATRSWNLAVAAFYKAGGIPWQVVTPVPNTCFVGISFHHRRTTTSDHVYSSLAQAFATEGDGFALRGGTVPFDPSQRELHLAGADAHDLLARVLSMYRDRMGRDPHRVVVHKTSGFNDDERCGIATALSTVPASHLVTLRDGHVRLLRQGAYPPHRGTVLRTGDQRKAHLYTTGYSSDRRTYKGPHIPLPVEVVGDEAEVEDETLEELLALTKMNWNSAEDHGRHPITLAFAQKVGAIMTEVPSDGPEPPAAYRYYM